MAYVPLVLAGIAMFSPTGKSDRLAPSDPTVTKCAPDGDGRTHPRRYPGSVSPHAATTMLPRPRTAPLPRRVTAYSQVPTAGGANLAAKTIGPAGVSTSCPSGSLPNIERVKLRYLHHNGESRSIE